MANPKRKGYKDKKVQIFIIFLIAAFLAWLVSKMSETYTDEATFSLTYKNVPDSLFLKKASKEEIGVRLRTTGFQFLALGLKKLTVVVDLSSLDTANNKFYMPPSTYRQQVERQLSDNISLLQMAEDTLFFDFVRVYEKKVAVRSKLTLKPAQNYLLEGGIKLDPEYVTVRGPLTELDTIDFVYTEMHTLEELTEKFSLTLSLILPDNLAHTTYSEDEVTISGSVFRFSETVLKVPVQVLNLPEGTEIKTFPNEVRVLCKARVDRLKDLNPSDIRVIADYSARRSDPQILRLRVLEKPEGVYSAELEEEEVEFILRRL